jgi:hypothetical protein
LILGVEQVEPWSKWMFQKKYKIVLVLVLLLAVAACCFLPNAEHVILLAVERTGFVLLVARLLKEHFDDFFRIFRP